MSDDRKESAVGPVHGVGAPAFECGDVSAVGILGLRKNISAAF
jgi:hypothetical protein